MWLPGTCPPASASEEATSLDLVFFNNKGTQNKKSGLYLGSHYHILTYFGSLNTNSNSENLHYPPFLSKSLKKLQNPENRQELQFHFENYYIPTFMHFSHLIPIYLWLSNLILTSMNINNPQVLKKSFVKALIIAKNRFHVMKAICPEITH